MKIPLVAVSFFLALSIFLASGYGMYSVLGSFNITQLNNAAAEVPASFIGDPIYSVWSNSSLDIDLTYLQPPYVINSTGDQLTYTPLWNGSATDPYTLEAYSTADLSLDIDTATNPGRYSGMFVINDEANSSDNATVPVEIFVPISFNPSGTGLFAGMTNGTINDTYYFNMSSINYTSAFRISIFNTTAGFPGINLRNGTGLVEIPQQSAYNIIEYKSAEGVVLSQYIDPVTWWSIATGNGTNSSFSGTIELLSTNFIIDNTLGNRTFTIKTNRGNSQTFLLGNFVLNNKTTSDVIYEVSVPVAGSLIVGTNLTGGTLAGDIPFNFSVAVNTTNTSNAAGVYTSSMIINTTGGYPYRDLKLTAIVNVTSELLGLVTNVTNSSGSSTPLPGNNITVTLVPTYQNGNLVSGLGTSNITNVWAVHRNSSSFTNVSGTLSNLGAISLVSNGTAYALTTGAVPSAALGGTYDFYVTVSDGLNTQTYSTVLNLNDIALRLSISNGGNCATNSLAASTDIICGVNATNYGYVAAQNVFVTPVAGSCLTPIYDTGYIQSPGIASIGTVNAGSIASSSPAYWKFRYTGSSTCALAFNVNASNSAKFDIGSVVFTLSLASAPNTTTPNTGSGSGSTPLSTPSKKELKITDFPATVEMIPGGSKTVTIKVKNTGDFDVRDVKMTVTGLDKSWWNSKTSPITIIKGTEKSYTLEFTIPADATGDHSIKFVANGTYVSSAVQASADAKLKISGSAESNTSATSNTSSTGSSSVLGSIDLTGLYLNVANNPLPFLGGAVAIIAILLARFRGMKLNIPKNTNPPYTPQQKGKLVKTTAAKQPVAANPQAPQIKQQTNKLVERIKNLFKKKPQSYSYSGF
ncbi:MAG TPA: hypothetical protein VJH90_02180 [archaeon]|nr:hypothetical protein [archaeon]